MLAIVALENKKLKGSTWCLLDRLADSYNNRADRRNQQLRAEKSELRRRQTEEVQNHQKWSDTEPEDKSLFYVL
jgi:hypothetical protein